MSFISSFLLAYLIGSFPTAYLIARAQGKDIFSVGSNNMGAMNTARNLNLASGITVLLIDIAKGALAVYFISSVSTNANSVLAASVAVILGHAFSVFIGFRGGKGLATALGVSFVLYPLAGIISLVLIIVLSLILKKKSNLAAVIATVAYPVLCSVLLAQRGSSGSDFIYTIVSVVIFCSIILLKHLADLKKELFTPD